MPSNSLRHFITKVINLEDVKVINYHFITDDEILIELQNLIQEVPCPNCEKLTSKIHQNHWYRVRDIPLSNYDVFLQVNRLEGGRSGKAGGRRREVADRILTSPNFFSP